MKHVIAFSSASHEWCTPPALFAALDKEFAFTLDAAASDDNALCATYFTKASDALTQTWSGTVYCNPPYGPGIGAWIAKGYAEAQAGSTVVMLVPARTETAWWHDYVMRAAEVRLIRGRLSFINDYDGAGHNAPFPSCIVVFRPGDHTPVFSAMDRPPKEP